jgi:F-type H+-transporting ATPase subunit b
MGTFLLLMAEATAEAAHEGGFGLNTNILETNLINLAIIVTVLFIFGRKALGNTLKARQETIETAIKNAESRLAQAQTALETERKKLSEAKKEAETIKKAAQENAVKAKEAILAQAAVDVERMKATASADVSSERDKAIAQLRQKVVALALAKAESELKAGISQSTQEKLVDRSIALLGG